MVKFIIGNSESKQVIIGLGLSHKNLDALRAGYSVEFGAEEFQNKDLYLIEMSKKTRFLIFSDKDEDEILKKLREKDLFKDMEVRDFRTDHSGKKLDS